MRGFDGMRKNATREMNNLQCVIEDMLSHGDNLYDEDVQKLKEQYNRAAQSVDIMNCLYDDNIEGDVNNLSHLVIFRFEEDDE